MMEWWHRAFWWCFCWWRMCRKGDRGRSADNHRLIHPDQPTNQTCDNIHKCTIYQPKLWQYTQLYQLCDNTKHFLHSHQPPFHTLWYLCCTHFGIAVSWTQILVYSVEGCKLWLFWHPFNPREHNVPTNSVIHTIQSSGAGTAAIYTLYQPTVQTAQTVPTNQHYTEYTTSNPRE